MDNVLVVELFIVNWLELNYGERVCKFLLMENLSGKRYI